MNNAKVRGYLILVAVFLLGGITGAGAIHIYEQAQYADLFNDPRGGRLENRRLRALARRLDLDEHQRERVRDILKRHRARQRELAREMMDRCGGPLQQHKAVIDQEVRTILRPEQRERFDRFRERRHRRF